MSDKLLRENLIAELDFDPQIDAAPIGVAVERGVVTLTGHVGSYAEKLAVERAVKRVKGVRGIAQEVEVRQAGDKEDADDQIAQRALAIIGWSARVPAGSVMVEVRNRWITLEGQVEWQYQRMAAEAAVRKLSGVIGVTNLIAVRPRLQPRDIHGRIMSALRRNAELEADAIQVVVKGDTVTLEGRVKALRERAIAERAAWSAAGVRVVQDHLTLG